MAALGEALKALRAAFRTLDVGWYLFGAQAAIVYGVARATADTDVTLIQGEHPSMAVADALVAKGFALRFPDENFIKTARVIPCVHRAAGMPVDVVLGGGGFDDVFLSRAVKRRVDGVLVPVAAAEDIVVMKVAAARERDIRDVIAMLRSARTSVDAKKVRQRLGALEAILDQSDLLRSFEELLKQARMRGKR